MNRLTDARTISLQPVTDADREFLLQVYKGSRRDDLRELGWAEGCINEFLDLQNEAQERFHQSDHRNADDQIVLCEGEAVGRIMVERRDREIRCLDLALLPEHRNVGIGTYLIEQLQDEARSGDKLLRLQVIRFSPAVRLFERLGFARTSETGTHFQMEWSPRS